MEKLQEFSQMVWESIHLNTLRLLIKKKNLMHVLSTKHFSEMKNAQVLWTKLWSIITLSKTAEEKQTASSIKNL